MAKNSKKKAVSKSKPKDRFDEIKDVIHDVGGELNRKITALEKKVDILDSKTGIQYDKLNHEIGLVAEKVEGQGNKLNVIQHDIEMIKYDLKEKVDTVELINLSRRITELEKKVASRK